MDNCAPRRRSTRSTPAGTSTSQESHRRNPVSAEVVSRMTVLDTRRPSPQPYDLDDRYRPGSGSVLLTGVQAIGGPSSSSTCAITAPAGGWRRSSRATRQPTGRGGQDACGYARGPRRTRHHVGARTQRGTGGHIGLGKSNRLAAGDAHPRRRSGSLVRQGPRPRPGDRRDPARQHVRRQPQWRSTAPGRRRSGLQVLHGSSGQ